MPDLVDRLAHEVASKIRKLGFDEPDRRVVGRRHWPLLTPAEQKAAHIDVIKGGPRRTRPQTHTEWSLRRFPPSNFVHA